MHKHKTPLFLVIAVFVLPMILSAILYFDPTVFKFKTTNHGTLLQPPLALKTGNPSPNKWQIIYVRQTACNDEICKNVAFQLQQIKKALGKDTDRVMVLNATKDDSFTQTLLAQNQSSFDAYNKIFLVDPIGNVFMYYQDTTPALDILKDMKKVLEVSQIG